MINKNLFLKRLAAFVIDLAAFYVPARIAGFNHGELIPAWLIYEAFSTHWKGFTLGKFIIGLRVTDLKHKQVPITKSFLRSAGKLLSTAALFLGCLMSLWDKKSQAWHDRWADTLVHNFKRREMRERKHHLVKR